MKHQIFLTQNESPDNALLRKTILYTYTIKFHRGKIFRARHARIDGHRLLSNAVRTFVHLLFFFPRFVRPFLGFRRVSP